MICIRYNVVQHLSLLSHIHPHLYLLFLMLVYFCSPRHIYTCIYTPLFIFFSPFSPPPPILLFLVMNALSNTCMYVCVYLVFGRVSVRPHFKYMYFPQLFRPYTRIFCNLGFLIFTHPVLLSVNMVISFGFLIITLSDKKEKENYIALLQ